LVEILEVPAAVTRVDEVTGSSLCGASTTTGGKRERIPSENELAVARFQGEHATKIDTKLGA
jgi:NAD(P)H dehydrogenase (quinone)